MDYVITEIEQLEALYGDANPIALKKEIDYLHPTYQAFIKASPFAILATSSAEGLDASPRGDQPGFVYIQDSKTLVMPDRRGNNRLDSMKNIVRDPRVALLFLIPGAGETLRVNGRARISTDPALLTMFDVNTKLPKTVIIIHVDTVFFQCSRAIRRSQLWNYPEAINTVPSPGQILTAITNCEVDGEKYDSDFAVRIKNTLY